jgi:3-hydroxyisobutyrate dehydrogenase
MSVEQADAPAAAPTSVTVRGIVGLIGLGAMGRPIATNFLAAGHHLLVRDADPVVQQQFVADHLAADAAADFANCDVVVLILPDSDVVDRVVLGAQGVLAQLRPGSVIVDMGSSIPARTQALATAAARHGVHVLDAPVSGGVTRAKKADLAVMVGGDSAVLEAVRPLLQSTGSQIVHVGPVGSGHAAKALNNLLSATGLVAAAEVLLVGRKFGIDAARLLAVLNASSGRNQATETKYEKFILSHTYASGFAAALMRKDIGIALDLAHSENVPTVLGDTLGRLWTSAVDGLPPGADHTEVVRYLEQAAGVSLNET